MELKEEAKPLFIVPRVVPYAMIDKIEHEIERLVEGKIIKPVRSCDWTTPIIPVLKSAGNIRISGDYKVTLSKRIKGKM